MRAARISAAALLAGSALALAAPAATAVTADSGADSGSGSNITSFGFSVSPTTVAPGGVVTLQVTGCANTATASAPALFDDVTLRGSGSTKSATATVGADAKPGAQYDVTFSCGGEKGSTPLTISTGGPITPITPTGPVHTGFGGGVSGPDTTEVVLGVALAGAAGVLLFRRSRAPRH
jgi:plastocyanin